MHYIGEEYIFLFLIQVFILLTTAKIIGSLFQRFGFSSLAGEILTGIFFGPTILGRMFPAFHTALFPMDLIQQNMLETVSWIGVLFLLLATGFEINLSSAWKQGKAAFSIGIIGIIIPFCAGIIAFWWFPQKYWGFAANHLTFTLFLSTAASISALAVIAKILHDLEILKSDLGLTTLSGFVVNDLIGWMVFAFVLSFISKDQSSIINILLPFLMIILFCTICLTLGSKLVGFITKRIKQSKLPYPASVLTFITCLAILCGIITQWFGIHAILGFFLAGVMAGNTSEVSERTREILSQMVHSVFVPIFFASVGLKVDFIQNIDFFVVMMFSIVAIGGKFIGAWTGASTAKMSRSDSLSIGIAFIPGGAMEIVLGLLALEIGLISEPVFVAIVFTALLSSIITGPLLAWSIRKRRGIDIGSFLLKNAIIMDLKGKTKWDVIRELCEKTAAVENNLEVKTLIDAVQKREEIMGTGFEQGLAVPHCRISAINAPLIVFGRSAAGIDWDSRDGILTHFVFLILTPEKKDDLQIQILSAIARCMLKPNFRDQITSAGDPETIFNLLSEGLKSRNNFKQK